MDWSKAKNILIIAFIITNIFLAYVLINSRNTNVPIVGDDFIKDVKAFLLEKNIKVAVDIPKDIPSLPLFRIKYEIYNPQDIANRFLGKRYTTETIKGNPYSYFINGNKNVTVKNGNEIIYENTDTSLLYDNLTTNKAENIAKGFIEDKGFSVDDYKLSIINHEDGAYFIEYTKIIDDFYFEKSYMRFIISSTGINRFERYWIESAESDDPITITIMSAPRALLKLLAMEEAYDKTIEEISICYYLDPQKHMGASDPGNTKGGKATPAWRIIFDDGTKIFLEDN
ncbi:two-component system regulatory protein YycI [Proteiniborus sp. MB09-C3]|uniref:two-component system regulatory protein YycI n=1 Tax=Proteiniborus sp. MB09-C3 TaxID=3050072 RepID=UPI002554338A|nr:two-component system regulatory protein YycI [Proteiniborus sp. MB09-C3]WIV12504.1 two-component system regulatory protein YycI [Proteiniborus sp. MB09-C3]